MQTLEWLAIAPIAIAVFSIAINQFRLVQQLKSKAKADQYVRTTNILFNILDKPHLLEAMSGGDEGAQDVRRLCQIWINHILMFYRQRKLYDRSEWKSTVTDIQDFVNMPPVKSHWLRHRQYYGEDFQAFINPLLDEQKEGDPPGESPPAEPKVD